jgi:solute carrier family 25 carnitine/acylcarnitine transporter 20/29
MQTSIAVVASPHQPLMLVGAGHQIRPTTLGALKSIFRQEGAIGLYRGVSAPLLAVTPAFALTFWSYDVSKQFLLRTSPHEDLTVQQTMICGGISGIPLATVVGPSERIKCLMQVDKLKYSSFFSCASQLYAEGGLRSIFRGTGATLLRDCPGNAAYFGTYEFLKRSFCRMEGTEQPSLRVAFLAGGFAGVANWIVAIPFDVVKSRYQTATTGTYRNLMEVLRRLIQEEGTRALFCGLSPALIRAFPANAACLGGVETARGLLVHLS